MSFIAQYSIVYRLYVGDFFMAGSKEAEIAFFARTTSTKSAVKAARRNAQVPCIVYSQGQVGTVGLVSRIEIEAVLRKTETGFLPTTIFILKDQAGKSRRCIVKEIQYNPTTYQVTHLDFFELIPDRKVCVKVPLQCLGQAECVGIKAGGFLRQVKLHIPVSCLPKDIPSHFEVDVVNVDIRQVKCVSDLVCPKDVEFLLEPKEVVATIVK